MNKISIPWVVLGVVLLCIFFLPLPRWVQVLLGVAMWLMIIHPLFLRDVFFGAFAKNVDEQQVLDALGSGLWMSVPEIEIVIAQIEGYRFPVRPSRTKVYRITHRLESRIENRYREPRKPCHTGFGDLLEYRLRS